MRSIRHQVLALLCTLFAVSLLGGVFAAAQSTDAEKENRAKQYFNEGVKAKQEGKTAEAILAYQGAITLMPDYVDAHINLGGIYFEQEKFDEALKEFKAVTDKDPKNLDGLVNLGRVQYRMTRYQEAEAAFKAALALKTDDPDILRELGKTYYYLKNYTEAVNVITKCHTAGSGDNLSWYMLGMSQGKGGDTAKAIASLQKSIELQPKYYESRSALGSIYLAQEKYPQAAAQFKAALEAAPTRYRASYNYAIAMEYAHPNNVTDNVANWEDFIRRAKNNPQARNDVQVAQERVDALKKQKAATGLE